ncbi:MAG TPA: hypothetical protein VL793_07995 [Patescibacteria group bacterium]|jgi:hypothetical protein|nr:hypothetical protein [Patescibacteria group bacterium]
MNSFSNHRFRISDLFQFSAPGFRFLYFLLACCTSAPLLADEANGASDLPPSSLKPPRGEIMPSFWEQHGTLIIIGGILLLAAIGAGLWLVFKPKPPVPVPFAVEARHQLEALGDGPEDGVTLSRTSQVLRRYIAASFGLPSLELTTTEFCRAVNQNAKIGQELSQQICRFLQSCDVRKFAPGATGPELGAVSQCLALIERTESDLAKRKESLSADPTSAKGILGSSGGAEEARSEA